MNSLHMQTPVLESQYLNNTLGKQVWFKLDCLQPSGSFKIRGIGELCQQEKTRGITSLI